MILDVAMKVILDAFLDSLRTKTLAPLTEGISSSGNEISAIAALFGTICYFGSSDFNSFVDDEGKSMPVAGFINDLNERGRLDSDWLDGTGGTPTELAVILGGFDFYLMRLRGMLPHHPEKDQRAWATEYSAELATVVKESELRRLFSDSLNSAFIGCAMNVAQQDIADTIEFAWS